MRSAVVFAVALVACGCDHAIPLDAQLALGPSIRVANLEVWPVLTKTTEEVDAVLTLEQAQARKSVVISELANAQVGRLAIENRGDTRILACAGTIVTGGKQDRQLGEDIVVEPQTTVSVKAFCVEPGRWTGTSNFSGTSLKTSAPVRAAGQYSGNQRLVWYDIEIAQAASIVPRGSYGSVKDTADRRRSTVAKIEKHLRSQGESVVGYAYAIDGDAAGMRTFAHRVLLEPRLKGFVQAMCVEAEQRATDEAGDFIPPQITQEINRVPSAYRPASEDPLQAAPDAYDRAGYALAEAQAKEVLAHPNTIPRAAPRRRQRIDVPTLFRKLNATQEEIEETKGANRNGYRRAEEGNHSACYVRTKDGRWVPLTRDWTAK